MGKSGPGNLIGKTAVASGFYDIELFLQVLFQEGFCSDTVEIPCGVPVLIRQNFGDATQPAEPWPLRGGKTNFSYGDAFLMIEGVFSSFVREIEYSDIVTRFAQCQSQMPKMISNARSDFCSRRVEGGDDGYLQNNMEMANSQP